MELLFEPLGKLSKNITYLVKMNLLKKISELDIEIFSITARKKNVLDRLRKDKNILYNYILYTWLVTI